MNNSLINKAIDNVRQKSTGMPCDAHAVVTINFHPDRFTKNNTPILLAIAEDGRLKSQFETATSNGGLTAFKGGERWLWEQTVFNGAYDNAPNDARPKYGALNFRNYQTGGSARFGSAYFQLKPHVLTHTTFCFPDSYFNPTDFALADSLSQLIHKAQSTQLDLLDDYIEAHIHGTVSLNDDIDCLVLDPIYKSTDIERQATQLGIPIKWHNGYELDVNVIKQHPNYRGERYVALAGELAQNGKINAKLLGEAVTQASYDEQDIKKVWHYLARFGYKSTHSLHGN